LGFVAGTSVDCFDLEPVQAVVGVSDSVAYALTGNTRLLAYDGTTWHSNIAPAPYSGSAMWADASSVLVVGKAGTAMWYEGGIWTLDDPGTLEGFTSVWGASRSDIWAGTANGGVFHYDGSIWSEIGHLGGETCDLQPAVIDIEGVDDTVYFVTRSQMARWNGSEIESLANWTCSPTQARALTSITATGPKEIFVTIADAERNGVDRCSAYFVVRYDGKQFHRM
jgi:hypothetical protein